MRDDEDAKSSVIGEGGGPSKPSSPSSSTSGRDEHSYSDNSLKPSHSRKITLLKLDVKFEFPIYGGELNANNHDSWINHIEVYQKVEQMKCDVKNIQMDSLCMSG